ncbi:hypothetical protein BD408DRAFT_135768 [Parasitella parasitica]|nr:hypothetical protein BD408DRAFT_135768 [Parasitella parasitica]
MLRHFFARARPIVLIDPLIARRDLGLSRKSFIDLCILCGTDFSGTIRGMGPHRALEAIQKYGLIEQVLANLNPNHVPQDTFDYSLARHVSQFDGSLHILKLYIHIYIYIYIYISNRCLVIFQVYPQMINLMSLQRLMKKLKPICCDCTKSTPLKLI